MWAGIQSSAFCQSNEIGLFVGMSYYIGDINPGKQFYMPGLAIGGLYRKNFNRRWTLKATGTYGTLKGDDAKSKDQNQNIRNLSFKSIDLDFTAQMEFNFFRYELGHEIYKFTPYISAGLGLMYFNPKAELNGTVYKLHDLSTEGQDITAYPDRFAYKRLQPTIPFAIGFKWSPLRNLGLGLEWSWRKTFTDYIDDVSKTYANKAAISAERGAEAAALSDRTGILTDNTGRMRGNAKNNDWTSFFGLTVSFLVGNNKPCDAYNSTFE